MPSFYRMLRRLPAGNRVVGHHERDDLGRVLGRGAPVGVRGLVDLGALDGPVDRVIAEPAAARVPALDVGRVESDVRVGDV